MYRRALVLPKSGTENFFLWGPRQSGKTTLLRASYPDALWIDFLKQDDYARYAVRPELLRLELNENPIDRCRQIIIDEVQKVPELLDEIHWMIENFRYKFALCGSSARKVRRGKANLLGGRALRYELRGINAYELGEDFDLDRMLNRGYLPEIYGSDQYLRQLRAYVSDYLKEEIAAEGLVRSLPAFAGFLEAAALSDGSTINYTSIGRDCGVSNNTVKGYFQILEDTLLGRWLPAYRKRAKRRVLRAPKFYFFDVGIVNHLAGRMALRRGSDQYGHAFEHWVYHELSSYLECAGGILPITFWRLSTGHEVDFVVGHMLLAVEAKGSARINSRHLKALRLLKEEHPHIRCRVVVCLDTKPWRTDDGIDVLPAREFVRRLWSGDLMADTDQALTASPAPPPQ
ncbi:MAG: AAA family ATPase [Bacteroidota bacterium]|nr:AAA family ATPase [Bacteroidota bacterium]MDE2834805.1 AAA family ATPase [Bacteroidota bacterium]